MPVHLAGPQANETFSFTYLKKGKFGAVDPLNKNKKVPSRSRKAPASLSAVAAKPGTVAYGHSSTITGTLSTGQAGQKVDIFAQTCGDNNAKAVTTVTTTTGGAFTYSAQPALGTAYHARYKSGAAVVMSTPANVAVRPSVTLVRLAKNKFGVNVVANQSFVGKAIAFQRYVAKQKRWSTVRTVTLGTRTTQATPLAGTTVSSRPSSEARARPSGARGAPARTGCSVLPRREQRHDP